MTVHVDELFQATRARYLESLPEHLQKLGEIVRQTTVDGDLGPLAQTLSEMDVTVPPDHLEQFRDLLIVRRLDLKDLEPAARQRLRARILASEDPTKMSPDYHEAVKAGNVPKCCGCRYFVTPPNDGSSDSDKPCVAFGTKGADDACYGFVRTI